MSRVEIVRDGRVTTVTINRPEVRNALDAATQFELARAFDVFAADDTQWVAIVTGAGDKAFCAGHDLKQEAAGGGMKTPASGFGGLTARFDCPKPIIAAVNGVAMGGGFELALGCDIVVASANAVFALPEPRVGLAAMAGGMHRLPRVVGLNRAMGILLTGRQVSAVEALAIGIVNEITEGDVIALAHRWAEDILCCSPLAIRATKAGVHAALNEPLPAAIVEQWRRPELLTMLASADAAEGPAAFVEKRPPRWRGV